MAAGIQTFCCLYVEACVYLKINQQGCFEDTPVAFKIEFLQTNLFLEHADYLVHVLWQWNKDTSSAENYPRQSYIKFVLQTGQFISNISHHCDSIQCTAITFYHC